VTAGGWVKAPALPGLWGRESPLSRVLNAMAEKITPARRGSRGGVNGPALPGLGGWESPLSIKVFP
jgi:hypothetical protein